MSARRPRAAGPSNAPTVLPGHDLYGEEATE